MFERSTTDAIFALKKLLEKHGVKIIGVHTVFIDLEKAYDRVARQEIWRERRACQKSMCELYRIFIVRLKRRLEVV